MLATVKMGPPEDFTNFVNAVIDEASFDKLKGFIDKAREDKDAEVIFGGNATNRQVILLNLQLFRPKNQIILPCRKNCSDRF
jgi:acyl-CoA reductase-like NAD-dependent aldehyde dehydrogenase